MRSEYAANMALAARAAAPQRTSWGDASTCRRKPAATPQRGTVAPLVVWGATVGASVAATVALAVLGAAGERPPILALLLQLL